MRLVSRESIPVITLVVAFLVYPFLWPSAPVTVKDTLGYQVVARDLHDGILHDLHMRSPGYPLLLLLTGSTVTPGRTLFLVTLLCYLAGIYLLITLLRWFGTPLSLRCIYTLILVLPPYVEPCAYVSTEAFTAFLLALSIWLLSCSWRWSTLLAGLTIGLAALVRPTYAALGILLALILFLFQERKKAVGVLLGSSILVGGFCLHNWVRFEYFGVAPMIGIALSFKTPHVLDRLPEGPVKDVLLEERNKVLLSSESRSAGGYIWRAKGRLEEATGLTGHELDQSLLRLNLDLIRKAPLEYLREVGNAAWVYWFPTARELSYGESKVAQSFWVILHFLLVCVFWWQLVALTGTYFTHGLGRHIQSWGLLYTLAAAVVFYSMFVSILVTEGNPRYRAPTDGLILFMLVIGLSSWRRERKLAFPE